MDIKSFLSTSYTAFHATANAVKMLEENGFSKIARGDGTKIKRGGKYYMTINDSAFIAFTVGVTEKGLNIACAHNDSPCLKIKGSKLIDNPEGKLINVEVYGGLLLYSMLDIPLKIAGRAFVKTENGVECKLVCSDFNVNIPSLCIHHADKEGGLKLNPQTDMLPLIGAADDIYTALGITNVLDADLYVVSDVAPYYSGANGEYLVSPRLDNLTSTYSCVQGLITAEPKGISVIACFDNEEIGSGTKQGAVSVFLEETLRRVYNDLGYTENDFNAACANGLVLSIDNGHAMHQAHPEKSDVVNKVFLNGGIVIKHHANYSTDGKSSALIKAVLDKAEIPYQDYYNRSDIRCGGTLGLITSHQFAMDAVDIGLAELAMHSAIETVGAKDLARMTDCVKVFLSASFKNNENNTIIE